VGIQDIIEGKKQWRAHMARVKALPPDHEIVYEEIQRYLFKVGPVDLADGSLLSGIVDFFEESVAAGKDSPTYADVCQESLSGKPGTAEK